jgi:alpha-galactosidase
MRLIVGCILTLACLISFIHKESAPPPDLAGIWICADHPLFDGTTYSIYFDLHQDGHTVSGRIVYPWGERKITRANFDGERFALHDQTGIVAFTGSRVQDELYITSLVGPQKGKPRIARLDNNFHIPNLPPPLPLPAFKTIPAVGEASRPPMGWNSWNHFADEIDDKDVREIADAMVNSGLRDAGYRYVDIDDTWEGPRGQNGEITSNSKFPDMKALANYVHSKGLLLGIYEGPGPRTCGGYQGSFGHEEQDARTFAAWNVDLLKYDWCSAGLIYRPADMRAVYQKMGEALQHSGRKIVYSLCQYGRADVGTWGKLVGGSLWRTGPDIQDNWQSIAEIGFSQDKWTKFAGPGHWNDPDMLEVGNGGLTLEEARTHMTLWSMLAAPLLTGNDLRHMSPETISVLTNKAVIAIDQDALGRQGSRLYADGEIEVWKRDLSGGDNAFAIFNRDDQPQRYSVELSKIGLNVSSRPVRDFWRQTVIKPSGNLLHVDLPAHGVVVFRVHRKKT